MAQPYPPHRSDFNIASQRAGKGIDSPLDAAGHTALHMSVKKGDIAAVTRLLRLNANPHHPDKQGQTPLFEALTQHNIDMVKALLDGGATFRMEDDARRTPLMWAIEQNCDTRFLKQLVNLGCDLGLQSKSGRTPLHVAAAANRPQIVEYLIKNGALTDQADHDGKTAVHVAIESGANDALKELIARGANLVIRTKEIKTPLYFAADLGNVQAVDLLLAQPSARQTMNEYCSYGEGWNPLMAAVNGGRLEVAQKLLSLGANLSLRDNQNRQCLGIAVEKGFTPIVDLLLRHGAEVEKGPRPAGNTQPMVHRINISNPANQAAYGEILLLLYTAGANIDIQDASGQTALYRAADYRELYKVKPLLELGANPNQADQYGRRPIDASMAMLTWAFDNVRETVALLLAYRGDPNISPNVSVQSAPLHIAARNGRKEIMELLLSYNVVIDEPERSNGATPWLAALDTRNQEAAEMLRLKGADTTRKDKQLRGVLHLTAQSGFNDMLKTYLSLPALASQVNTADSYGSTPLHYACSMQKPDCVKTLLAAGANPDIYNSSGMPALHLAMNTGSEALIAAFESVPGKKINWNIQHRDDQETLLHITVRRSFQGMMERLLKQDVDINLKNKQGLTPLLYAVSIDQPATAGVLLNHMKANKLSLSEQRDPAGLTALHLAVRTWQPTLMNMVLDAGADINARATDGDTPLHTAVRAGRQDHVRILMARGADTNLANTAGATALDLALGLKQDVLAAQIQQTMKDQKEAAVKKPPVIKPPQP